MSRVVALTGGTGFIGRTVWQFLERAGWTVRPLIRASFAQEGRTLVHGEYVRGTLSDDKSLQKLVDGVDAVVYCAGTVRGLTPSDFFDANVAGVGRIMRLMTEHSQSPRFVLLSSLAAREPALSPYAQSKKDGEEQVHGSAGEIPWVILRPPAVYGPRDQELLPLFQWVKRGVGVCLGERQARFSMLYVDDLARAVVTSLEQGRPIRQIYELHDGHEGGYSWDEVFDILGKRTVRRLMVPGWVLRNLALLNQAFAKLFHYAPMLTPGKVRELRHMDWVCDNTKISTELGWVPQVTLRDGVDMTLRATRGS